MESVSRSMDLCSSDTGLAMRKKETKGIGIFFLEGVGYVLTKKNPRDD